MEEIDNRCMRIVVASPCKEECFESIVGQLSAKLD
jgi:hypothetical protein